MSVLSTTGVSNSYKRLKKEIRDDTGRGVRFLETVVI